MSQEVRVMSLCHDLQGPVGAQYLANMGTEVIKVEPIGGAHVHFIRHDLADTAAHGHVRGPGRTVVSLATGAIPATSGEIINVDGGMCIHRL